jgi:hypothetical protein
MHAFILGFPPAIDDSPLMATERAYQCVGDNTGNLAFCYAINRQLGSNLKSILWHAAPNEIDRLGSTGVITLSNQLGPHADMYCYVETFKNIQARLVGIGLGAQAGHGQLEVEIPAGTLNWIRTIQEHSLSSAPNISMRGEYSRSALDRYGLAEKTVALGCPTLFINPDKQLGKTIYNRFTPNLRHIAITAGHQRWGHLSRIEASLVQIAQATGGSYICQSPLEMVMLGRGEISNLSEDARNLCRNYAAPSMSDEEFINWCNRHAISFFSCGAWMDYLKRFDFVVGTRIHGVMLALQMGIPALCIAHDSRTVELCETMMVPYILAQENSAGLTRNSLLTHFKFDPEAFDVNRIKLAKNYVQFLHNNGLKPAKYLADLANSN